jgi:hypothetical protein
LTSAPPYFTRRVLCVTSFVLLTILTVASSMCLASGPSR